MSYLVSSYSKWTVLVFVFAFLFLAIPATGQTVLAPTALLSLYSNKCIDVAGGLLTDGTKAILFDCFGPPNQQFTLKPINGSFQLIASHSGKCRPVAARTIRFYGPPCFPQAACISSSIKKAGAAWRC
jgi:Ricin-type beta-trefoil lectin domain-like